MELTVALTWFAMAFIFLVSSIWSDYNVKYGYVLVPLMAGFFWLIGWIQFPYLITIIPIIIMMGVLSYLRTHLRTKFAVFGSSSGLLFKIVSFVIFLQFAIIVINGMGLFSTSLASDAVFKDNPFTKYNVTTAQAVYAPATTNMGLIDAAWNGLAFVWVQWSILWQMVFGFFNLYGTMVGIFHVPPLIAMVVSAGLYILTAIEVFVLVFKPFRAPEV